MRRTMVAHEIRHVKRMEKYGNRFGFLYDLFKENGYNININDEYYAKSNYEMDAYYTEYLFEHDEIDVYGHKIGAGVTSPMTYNFQRWYRARHYGRRQPTLADWNGIGDVGPRYSEMIKGFLVILFAILLVGCAPLDKKDAMLLVIINSKTVHAKQLMNGCNFMLMDSISGTYEVEWSGDSVVSFSWSTITEDMQTTGVLHFDGVSDSIALTLDIKKSELLTIEFYFGSPFPASVNAVYPSPITSVDSIGVFKYSSYLQ